jgi:single-stranded DNA-binding protein
VQALADIQDKEYFTVKGRLGMDQWTGDDGMKRQKLIIMANSIAPFSFESDSGESTDEGVTELEGEPA